jgi:hypothetical protein
MKTFMAALALLAAASAAYAQGGGGGAGGGAGSGTAAGGVSGTGTAGGSRTTRARNRGSLGAARSSTAGDENSHKGHLAANRQIAGGSRTNGGQQIRVEPIPNTIPEFHPLPLPEELKEPNR